MREILHSLLFVLVIAATPALAIPDNPPVAESEPGAISNVDASQHGPDKQPSPEGLLTDTKENPGYLRDNFGIPEHLSDCDRASRPITPAMNEADRRLALLLNDGDRSICRTKWQNHQNELAAEAQRDRLNSLESNIPQSINRPASKRVIQEMTAIGADAQEKAQNTLLPGGEDVTRAFETAQQFQGGGLNNSDAKWFDARTLAEVAIALVAVGLLAVRLVARFSPRFRDEQLAMRNPSVQPSDHREPPLWGLSPFKQVVASATLVAILMFAFPPTNDVFGAGENFVGWHPLWTMGYVPETVQVFAIAYPTLLAEWGLLALVAFAATLLAKSR